MIEESKIPQFKEKFIQSVSRSLKDQDIRSKLYLDAKISFADLTFDFMESLHLLEPFGNGNPAPIFYCDVKQIWPPKVVGKSHLKLYFVITWPHARRDWVWDGRTKTRTFEEKPLPSSRLQPSCQHLSEQNEHPAASPRFHCNLEGACKLLTKKRGNA